MLIVGSLPLHMEQHVQPSRLPAHVVSLPNLTSTPIYFSEHPCHQSFLFSILISLLHIDNVTIFLLLSATACSAAIFHSNTLFFIRLFSNSTSNCHSSSSDLSLITFSKASAIEARNMLTSFKPFWASNGSAVRVFHAHNSVNSSINALDLERSLVLQLSTIS